MNIHVSQEIKNKYFSLEFRGKPWKFKGRTIISARHRVTEQNFFYSFEEDFAWFKDSIPDWFLPKV